MIYFDKTINANINSTAFDIIKDTTYFISNTNTNTFQIKNNTTTNYHITIPEPGAQASFDTPYIKPTLLRTIF